MKPGELTQANPELRRGMSSVTKVTNLTAWFPLRFKLEHAK